MVSRERLLRLGATGADVHAARQKPAVRLLGRLLVLALLVLLAFRLWQLWRREPVDFGPLDVGVFAAAVVASVAAVSAYGLVWLFLLRRLGTPAPLSWITLFFKSQLAKYLPGSVWQYAGRMASRTAGGCRSAGTRLGRRRNRLLGGLRGSCASLTLGSVAAAGVFVGLAVLLRWGCAHAPLRGLIARARSPG